MQPPDIRSRSLNPTRPLSSLLSQVLVAFTIEFDNEFERQMNELGYPGSRLSLVAWSNLIRFIPEKGVTVRDLGSQSPNTFEQIKAQLGCLERWGFVALQSGPKVKSAAQPRASPRSSRDSREGWGSGRGIRSDWMAGLTDRGLRARAVWPPLFEEIEQRWKSRLGDHHLSGLRQSLQLLAGHGKVGLPLPTLLSEVLLAFATEFDRRSPVPLALCANAIRVLGKTPVHVAEISRLTGGSPEMSGIGWQLKPFVVVEPAPARSRGKIVRLSSLGLEAQRNYLRLIREVEHEWETRFGKPQIARLHESLQFLFTQRDDGSIPIAAGLIPPAGVARAGAPAPSLGRREVGPAARQRMRDLVAQTQTFIRDPANALPHFPLWDMNRGFGP